MRRTNKRALYESIMKDVAKVVKRHLNEKAGEFYVWYANQEEGATHDLSEEEINSYRLGWQVAGPFISVEQAKAIMLKTIDEELLDSWWEVEDYWYEDQEDDDVEEPTDEEKLAFIKNYGSFVVSSDGKYAYYTQQPENYDYNTMEWYILTPEEIKDREEEYSMDYNDDEFDEYED